MLNFVCFGFLIKSPFVGVTYPVLYKDGVLSQDGYASKLKTEVDFKL